MRPDAKGRTLSERVATARSMHAGGADTEAIGAVLAVAPSTVESYLKARPCVVCGDPVIKGSAYCRTCGRNRASTPTRMRWTPRLVLAALRSYEKEFGKPPTVRALSPVRSGYPDASTVRRYFGTFGAALKAAGLKPHAWKGWWTREKIVEAMRQFQRENRYWPRPSDWAVASESSPTHRTVRIRFGSWQAALHAAAGPKLKNGDEVSVRPPKKKWTREQIVKALRSFVEEFGKVPTPKDLNPPPPGYPWVGTVRQNFSSLPDALRASGLELPTKLTATERIIEAMLRFRGDYGRWPRPSNWSRASEDWPCERTVRNHFGSWQAALAAAMENRETP